MPSPFPGVDPWLENPDLWSDVHARLITTLAELLAPGLRPRYVARVEQRTFMFDPGNPADELYVVPDARVVEQTPHVPGSIASSPGGTLVAERAAIAAPIDVTGLIAKAAVQRYLAIRDHTGRRIVTVIELVSPSNKAQGSSARQAFVRKREEVGRSDASWLEIDLLRGGTRTIRYPRIPGSAYLAYADRTDLNERRQLVWPILLRGRLPRLGIPLRPGEADVTLDLQAALDVVYDRAAYDIDVDRTRPPDPPLDAADAAWADALLRQKRLNP